MKRIKDYSREDIVWEIRANSMMIISTICLVFYFYVFKSYWLLFCATISHFLMSLAWSMQDKKPKRRSGK